MQRENIGLAKLRDGTRLVRVGEALAWEQAVWRYGSVFPRRAWRRGLVRDAAEAGARVIAGGASLVPVVGWLASEALRRQAAIFAGARIMHRLGTDRWHGGVLIRRWHLETATLAPDGRGGVELRFPYGLDRAPGGRSRGGSSPSPPPSSWAGTTRGRCSPRRSPS